MPLKHYVYIFRAKDIKPPQNTAEIKTNTMLFLAIGVHHVDYAAGVAKEEMAKGAQRIDLCGAFGISGIQKVIDNAVPVGNVQYSLSGIHKLLELLKGH